MNQGTVAVDMLVSGNLKKGKKIRRRSQMICGVMPLGEKCDAKYLISINKMFNHFTTRTLTESDQSFAGN